MQSSGSARSSVFTSVCVRCFSMGASVRVCVWCVYALLWQGVWVYSAYAQVEGPCKKAGHPTCCTGIFCEGASDDSTGCFCDRHCYEFDSCCEDINETCPQGPCVASGYLSCCVEDNCKTSAGCFCDELCYRFQDCCYDITSISCTEGTVGGDTYLLFANQYAIRRINLDGSSLQTVVTGEDEAAIFGMDYNYRMDPAMIYWSDTASNSVMKASLNGSQVSIVKSRGLGRVVGLAVDWITNRLYWTDEFYKRIDVFDVERSLRKNLIFTGANSTVRGIAVDPSTRWMYWTDCGNPAKIEKASMDGTSRTVLHDTDLVRPNGITLDYEAQVVYWIDAFNDVLEFSNVDGTNRKVLQTEALGQPFGLTLYDKLLYWTDWSELAILSTRKAVGDTVGRIVANLTYPPMSIQVVSPDRQRSGEKPCSVDNGGCSDLCLLSINSNGYSCDCREGSTLLENQKDCLGSCKAAGYRSCCTNEQSCLGFPQNCDCDEQCHFSGTCCYDINDTCPTTTSSHVTPTPTHSVDVDVSSGGTLSITTSVSFPISSGDSTTLMPTSIKVFMSISESTTTQTVAMEPKSSTGGPIVGDSTMLMPTSTQVFTSISETATLQTVAMEPTSTGGPKHYSVGFTGVVPTTTTAHISSNVVTVVMEPTIMQLSTLSTVDMESTIIPTKSTVVLESTVIPTIDTKPTTTPTASPSGVPGPVSQLTLQSINSSSGFMITWVPPSAKLIKYNITVTSHVSGVQVFDEEIPEPTLTSFNVPSLEPFVPYTVTVRAATSFGYGPSVSKVGFTEEGVPLVAPSGFTVTRTNGREITASWNELSLVDARGFVIAYGLNYTSESGREYQLLVPENQTNASVEGLDRELSYSVSVSGITVAGTGVATDAVVVEADKLLFQLQMIGNISCESWKEIEEIEKFYEVKEVVVGSVDCSCEFSAEDIVEANYYCFEDFEASVTFRAKLYGTEQANSTRIVGLISQWVHKGDTIDVRGTNLTISRDCPVRIESYSDAGCDSALPTQATSSSTQATPSSTQATSSSTQATPSSTQATPSSTQATSSSTQATPSSTQATPSASSKDDIVTLTVSISVPTLLVLLGIAISTAVISAILIKIKRKRRYRPLHVTDELVMTTLERSTEQMETSLTNYMSLDEVGRSTSKRARELEASPLAPSGTGEGSDSDSEKEIIVPYPPI